MLTQVVLWWSGRSNGRCGWRCWVRPPPCRMFFERIIWPGLVVGLAWAGPTWQVLVAPTCQRGGGTHLAGSGGTHLAGSGGTRLSAWGWDPPGRPVGGTYLAGQGMWPTWQASWRDLPVSSRAGPPGRSWAAVVQDPPVSSVRDPPSRSVGGTHLSGRGWLVWGTHLSGRCWTHMSFISQSQWMCSPVNESHLSERSHVSIGDN
jgi:hypothetical protein